MNQLFSRKAFLPYSRLVCNFRHFGAFSELDFKGLSDLKTWMDFFLPILQEVVNIWKKNFPSKQIAIS